MTTFDVSVASERSWLQETSERSVHHSLGNCNNLQRKQGGPLLLVQIAIAEDAGLLSRKALKILYCSG